jgi:hypothetical protein
LKRFIFTLGLTFASCTHYPVKGNEVAFNESKDGLIQAYAKRRPTDQNLCFDIEIGVSAASAKEVSSSNWSIAWVDQHSRYHLLSLTQRHPASVPEFSGKKWKNYFRTCAPANRLGNVGSLILTPKFLTNANEEIKLSWK